MKLLKEYLSTKISDKVARELRTNFSEEYCLFRPTMSFNTFNRLFEKEKINNGDYCMWVLSKETLYDVRKKIYTQYDDIYEMPSKYNSVEEFKADFKAHKIAYKSTKELKKITIEDIEDYLENKTAPLYEYLSTKVNVSKVRHDIDDINRLLCETFDIKLVKKKNDSQFDEITYWYEYSDDMFNLFRDYYNNIGSTKLNQELHEYTNLDKRLEFRIHNLNAHSCNAYCIETISSPSRREIFVNCIKYNDGDKDRIIVILKTDTDIDLYDNTYIILKYLFEQMS